MKVAFCLSGLAGGVNDKHGGLKVDYNIAYDYYQKHIFEHNDVDVFIHTWSVDFEKPIMKLYNPKKSIFQEQIMFDDKPSRKHSIYSRWYSTEKVIELKKSYELENNFSYDCVFLTRFDLAFFSDILFKDYDLNHFFAPHWTKYKNILGQGISNRGFYQAMKKSYVPDILKKFFYRFSYCGYPFNGKSPPDYGGGIEDFWFFSNSKDMDQFSTLFDNLDNYLSSVSLSNHVLAVHHLSRTDMIKNLNFTKHRFIDFAMVRRKFFESTK